jgi:LuxR family transcriptional regulator, maltose regulon positive regulatory protein
MEPLLLQTKVHIPRVARQTIGRPRLVKALDAAIPAHKLVLVSAPAGYGKTTLLSQWARSSQLSVAWLSLNEEDSDPERFIRYIFRAWEQVQPAIRDSVLGVMLEGSLPEFQAVLSAFLHEANEADEDMAFVLDDYHLVEDSSIHQALAYLLDRLPQSFHFVLSTRADPPLPLARYRARAEMLELRTEELKFRVGETEDFFGQFGGLELSKNELEALQEQTEGWAAGLRLVGITFQRGRPLVQPMELTGKQRYISDYIGQEVLAGLPDGLQRFLLETSVLSQLSAPLCEAVTGVEDSQGALERTERENLFLFPLDEEREWYRYHGLFAGYLRGELARRYPERLADLHRRASHWYLQHDLPEQAYQHALAAKDLKLMASIFERYANAKLLAGEYSDLKRWIDSLPADWFSAYPALNLARAGYLAYTGAIDASRQVVDQVEKSLTPPGSEDTRWQLARLKAVRCFMACMGNDLRQAEAYAGQALDDLPEEDLGFRPGIYAALGDTYRQNGLWGEARQCYLKAIDFTQSPSVRVSSAHLYGALADLELRQGRLRSAAGYWEKALESIQMSGNWGRIPLPVAGWIYTRKAELLYEWNELEAASQDLRRGLERAQLGGDTRTQIAAYLLSARTSLALGEVEKAAEYFASGHQLVEQSSLPEWVVHYERCQLELWLAENRLGRAMSWSEKILERGLLDKWSESEAVELGIARVLIEKGEPKTLERAERLLKRLLGSVEEQGRLALLVEALALQALACWRRGDLASAMSALERSLRIAEPEGYLRRFVDLGLPMARLLQEARARGVMVDYVSRLLQAFDGGLLPPGPGSPALPEPLTQREQEILELLAAGLTNREIAGQFYISPETVKKHVASISGKLGTRNRTEAVARARELGLLH